MVGSMVQQAKVLVRVLMQDSGLYVSITAKRVIYQHRYLCTVVIYDLSRCTMQRTRVRAPLSIVSAVPAWVVEERGLGILSGEALEDIVVI